MMNGELGTAAGRGDLVRLALRLIVEEALEGEVSDGNVTSAARTAKPAIATVIGRARSRQQRALWTIRLRKSGTRLISMRTFES